MTTTEECRHAFTPFEEGCPGKIHRHHVGDVIRTLRLNMRNVDVEKLVREAADEAGYVTVDAFVSSVNSNPMWLVRENNRSVVVDVFETLDRDGDGFISVSELKRVMTNLGEMLSEEELRSMLHLADSDGDGRVNLSDFLKLVESLST